MFKPNPRRADDFDDAQPRRRWWRSLLLRRRRWEAMPDEPLRERSRRRWLRLPRWSRNQSAEAMVETADLLAVAERRRRRRQLALAALPALLTSAAFGGVLISGATGKDATSRIYRDEGRKAMEAGDVDKARFYYTRLIASSDLGDSRDQLNWASMLASTGDHAGALKLIDRLAPDGQVGYGPAHREKAILLMRSAADGQLEADADFIQLLQFHLTHGARDQSIDSHQLWAYFYLATGQPDRALSRRAQAAQQNPDLWLEVAALCGPGNPDRLRYLGRAETHAQAMLAQDPLDFARRVMLVHALVQQERTDDAEQVLRSGLALQDRPELRRLYSDLYLVRMGQELRAAGAGEQLQQDTDRLRRIVRLVGQASDVDPQNPAVYQQWAALYSRIESDSYRRQLRENLERSIVAGESIAFAHFTLGGMLWMAGEQERSLFHTETAFKQDPRFMDAANNMAFMLANKDADPDLDAAERLIRQALDHAPDKIAYLDTLGDILVKRQQWDEALTVLERVLPRVDPASKKLVHGKLATVYDALGQPALAAQHQQMAGDEAAGRPR